MSSCVSDGHVRLCRVSDGHVRLCRVSDGRVRVRVIVSVMVVLD